MTNRMVHIIPLLALLTFGLLLFSAPVQAESLTEDEVIEIIGDWETPFESSEKIMDRLTAAEESGSCYAYLHAKNDLILEETQYWHAMTLPGTDAFDSLSNVMDNIELIQYTMGLNRLMLENTDGDTDSCEQSEDDTLSTMAAAVEQNKLDMRLLGYHADTDEDTEIEKDDISKRCRVAHKRTNLLAKRVAKHSKKFRTAVENGEDIELSNAQELLQRAESSLGIAASRLDLAKKANQADEQEVRMRNCSGAVDYANIGLAMAADANAFYIGDEEDNSSEAEHMDAEIKNMITAVTEKRMKAIGHEKGEEIITRLNEAKEYVISAQTAYAQIKYEESPDLTDVESALESARTSLASADELIDSAERVFKKKRQKKKSRALILKSKKQVKKLKRAIAEASENADTDEELSLVQYAQQTALLDAITARNAARAYTGKKKHLHSVRTALKSMEISKNARAALEASIK